jgi:hypothetical protein
MDADALFEAWAPTRGLWTPWAKPVLFANNEEMGDGSNLPGAAWVSDETVRTGESRESYRATSTSSRTAVVVDLPGAESVAVGIALGSLGFRPVPLYTALPSPNAVVPMSEVARAVIVGADRLRGMKLPADAPPAFLLDSRRDGAHAPLRPGQFDNRSMVFATDVPSPERLRAHGIEFIVVLASSISELAIDIKPIILGWQRAGLKIWAARSGEVGRPQALHVQETIRDRVALWWRRNQLTRDSRGAFGAWIPEHRQGG